MIRSGWTVIKRFASQSTSNISKPKKTFRPPPPHSKLILGPSIGTAHLRKFLDQSLPSAPYNPHSERASYKTLPSDKMSDSPDEGPLRKRPRLDQGQSVVLHEPEQSEATASASLTRPAKTTQKKSQRDRGKRHKRLIFPAEEHDNDGVLWREIISLLGLDSVKSLTEQEKDWETPEYLRLANDSANGNGNTSLPEINVRVVKLGYNGQAIGIPIPPAEYEQSQEPQWAVVLPFALPGEVCKVAVYSNSRLHSKARLLQVVSTPASTALGLPITPSTSVSVESKFARDESQIRCPHFMTCGGCQYQFLPYSSQLQIKRDSLVKAFTEFYSAPGSPWTPPLDKILPEVHGSPLQYGYRTKISPHFDSVPRIVKRRMGRVTHKSGAGLALEADLRHRDVKGWNPEGYHVPSTSTLLDGTNNSRVLEQLHKNKVDNDTNHSTDWIAEIDAMSIQEEEGQKLHCGPKPSWFRIGFTSERGHLLDIEECPLATPHMNEQYKKDRKDIARAIYNYEKGATLLYRDSLDPKIPLRDAQDTSNILEVADNEAIMKEFCVTSHTDPVRQKVGDYFFEYTGGSFFQCNHAILEGLVKYVQESIFNDPSRNLTHLVDTYCGSGLFAISLYPFFKAIAGIELSAEAIHFAKHNAWINSMDGAKIRFQDGDAADIFAGIRQPFKTRSSTKPFASKAQLAREKNFRGVLEDPPSDSPGAQPFPPENSVVIIDPPRKGSSPEFVNQLLSFGPQKIVYVSCNSVTQARDIGWIVRGNTASEEPSSLVPGTAPEASQFTKWRGYRYVVESIKGFDLFPQTAHIESVAVLKRIDI